MNENDTWPPQVEDGQNRPTKKGQLKRYAQLVDSRQLSQTRWDFQAEIATLGRRQTQMKWDAQY